MVARSATTSKAAAQRTNTAASNAQLKRAHTRTTKRAAKRHIVVEEYCFMDFASFVMCSQSD
ncbi:hypothetical protein Sjap_016248 [Stephania japonica]|uniref:Uncharacterized protein n=1 Tax=Stephania japonica TaxID=461633 RepID=A0AAP0IMA8_9MAGN